jgi:hypothetical protein
MENVAIFHRKNWIGDSQFTWESRKNTEYKIIPQFEYECQAKMSESGETTKKTAEKFFPPSFAGAFNVMSLIYFITRLLLPVLTTRGRVSGDGSLVCSGLRFTFITTGANEGGA